MRSPAKPSTNGRKRPTKAVRDAEHRNGYAPAYEIHNMDAFEWLASCPSNSIHAVVTDPPYGLVEYTEEQLTKLKNGKGGVWRIPPSFDGHQRKPLPRFTVLTDGDKASLRRFFLRLAIGLERVLVPGAHVFIATNPLVSHLVYEPFIDAGFEKRGEIIRTVYTLRGGDRPKNAHEEFSEVCVMPKSTWEPWGLFRKACDGRVQDNLRTWKTGGLRRISQDEPFKDLIESSPARGAEREIAPHPSLKPQRFMRQLVRASLPLEEGVILDPFMGSGATVAAASACGLRSIGLEVNSEYYLMAVGAIPRLAALAPDEGNGIGSKQRLLS
jgi:site-specific DNA-methyltransferase (adenine-specific)